MALPFIPEQHVLPIFLTLQSDAVTPALQGLVAYVETTWVKSLLWPPAAWSVYKQSVRTNNDVEGWHRRLNASGRENIPLSRLVLILHEEAQATQMQVRLVSERKLQRIQRRVYVDLQTKLFSAWADYENGTKNAMQLLRACAHLYGPVAE